MKKVFFTISLLLSLSSCAINSIDLSNAEKWQTRMLISATDINQKVEILVIDRRIEEFNTTELAKQVIMDMSLLSELF